MDKEKAQLRINIAWLELALQNSMARARIAINEAIEAEEFYQLQGMPVTASCSLTKNLEEIGSNLCEEFTRIRRDYEAGTYFKEVASKMIADLSMDTEFDSERNLK